VADTRARAARSDVVVVRHVDIEDQLFHDGPESRRFAHGLAVARVGAVLRPDFETRGQHLYALFSQEVGGGEGLVAQVGVVGECEGEFAVGEGGRWDGGVVEPLEEGAEGEKTLVEGAHYLGVGEGGFGRDLAGRLLVGC